MLTPNWMRTVSNRSFSRSGSATWLVRSWLRHQLRCRITVVDGPRAGRRSCRRIWFATAHRVRRIAKQKEVGAVRRRQTVGRQAFKLQLADTPTQRHLDVALLIVLVKIARATEHFDIRRIGPARGLEKPILLSPLTWNSPRRPGT